MTVPLPDGASPVATPPLAGVAHLVRTMERLRAPGGCPWDAQQTHVSLVQYLLEEAYEAAEAIEDGDREDLREELGDVLLQVVFHALIAAEDPEDPFTLDDLAFGVAQKLIRRHPHVFADQEAVPLSAEESHRRWDRIKTQEKARQSVLDGIPVKQSPLARAQKVLGRARRGGLELDLTSDAARTASDTNPAPPPTNLGERLLALVAQADAAGLDAEKELRAATRQVEAQIKQLEAER